jgi:hypothetical protein
MIWTLLVILHVVVFLLIQNREKEQKSIEKRVQGPFRPKPSPRFPEYVNRHGFYDPDQIERAKNTQRIKGAVDEIESAYTKVACLRKLNML